MELILIHEKSFTKEQNIVKVLPFSENSYAILRRTFKNEYYIDIENEGVIRIEIKLNSHNGLNNFCSLFKYKNGFGLADSFGKIQLWLPPFKKALKLQVNSPYANDVFKKSFLHQFGYNKVDNTFYASIEDETSIGFPGKYWAILKNNVKPNLFTNLIINKLKCENLYLLDLNNYPANETFKNDGDWLNIMQVKTINSDTYIYTNGGSNTRSKSGTRFEFSIVSKYDEYGKLVSTMDVEEGELHFAESNNHALIKSIKNKRLFIYSINEMKLIYSISLNSIKLNKKLTLSHISFDLLGNKLFLYSPNNLSIYKLEQ